MGQVENHMRQLEYHISLVENHMGQYEAAVPGSNPACPPAGHCEKMEKYQGTRRRFICNCSVLLNTTQKFKLNLLNK